MPGQPLAGAQQPVKAVVKKGFARALSAVAVSGQGSSILRGMEDLIVWLQVLLRRGDARYAFVAGVPWNHCV